MRARSKLAPPRTQLISPAVESRLDVNEGRMSIGLIFARSDTGRDSSGDLTEILGIDETRFRRNPVAFLDHAKANPLPIALCEDEGGNYTVDLDGVSQMATATLFFFKGKGGSLPASERYEHELFCEQTFAMAAAGFLRGGSFGYVTLAASPLPADPLNGLPSGFHLLKTLLLEISLTSLPCNADTVREVTGRKWMGKPLCESLLRHYHRDARGG